MSNTRAEVRLSELAKLEGVVDLDALKKAGVVPVFAEIAKVVLSGEIKKAVTLKGIGATKGARAAIEAAGGKIEAGEPKVEAPKKANGKLEAKVKKA
jgi:large subunit ribosomal protein L15